MTDQRYLKRTIVKEVVSQPLFAGRITKPARFFAPGLQRTLSFPVVYCQDGEHFFNFGRIATICEPAYFGRGLEPFIIVGVDVDLQLRTTRILAQTATGIRRMYRFSAKN